MDGECGTRRAVVDPAGWDGGGCASGMGQVTFAGGERPRMDVDVHLKDVVSSGERPGLLDEHRLERKEGRCRVRW